MKIVKIISALAAVCALVIGCAKETPNVWNEIQVSSSYVGIPTAGGSKTITVTATDSWSINAVPNWLTVSPTSGSAGETVVTFTASKALSNNENTIKIVCAGKEQTIIVRQDAEYVEPKVLTIDEALEVIAQYPDGSPTCRVKGIVCKITEISPSYGNATYYLSEDGKYDSNGKWLQVYRGLWLDGAAFKTGNEFAVGDEITIEGNLMSYKGTPETVEKNSYVIKHNPSLIKCDSLVVDGVKSSLLPIEGGQIDAVLTCKGDGITVSIPDDAKSWLSVSGIKTSGTVATVSLTAAQNAGGDRSTEVTFSTTSNGKSYTAVAALSQTGAIIECSIAEYLAAPEDQTQYRISGIITSVAQDSDKYGANLYIKDATGEVYVYGTTDNDGNIQTLAAFGAKDGDIIEFVGTRSSYKGTPQMAKGKFQWYKSVTPVTAAEVAALADDDKNDPQNYIKLTGKVVKNSGYDIEPYGNFDLVDDSGSILVYGVSTGWKGETKKFGSLGVEEGDNITIIAYKTSYKSNPQVVGMYVSHEKGGTPEPPVVEESEYSIDLAYTGEGKFYDDGVATINGEENQKVLKIGTSSAAGSVTFTVPAGSKKVTAYAIAWKDKATTLEFKVGDTVVATQEIAANEGASNNSPYTITVADTDKYTIDLGGALEADTQVTVTTAADANTRAIFFGVKAVK